jgi:hypothetical protein
MSMWHPFTEVPRCGAPVIMKAKSYARAPYQTVYFSGRYENPEGTTHPSDRWRTTDGINVREHKWMIICWAYVEDLENAMER